MTERGASTQGDSHPDEPFERLVDCVLERLRRGETLSIEKLTREYPEHEAEIRNVLPALILLESAKIVRKTVAGGRSSQALPGGRAGEPPGRPGIQDSRGKGRKTSGFLSSDPRSWGTVALQAIGPALAADPLGIARLEEHARIVNRLGHLGLCPILGMIESEEGHFLAFPYVRGESLAQRIKRARAESAHPGAPAPRSAVDGAEDAWAELRADLALVAELALAVHALHDAGIRHVGLNPLKIWIRSEGGLAFACVPPAAEAQAKSIARRTDVHALGAILQELSSRRLLRIPAPGPEFLRRIEAVCSKATSRDPTKRYATAAAFAEELRPLCAAVQAEPNTGPIQREIADRQAPLRRAWAITAMLIASIVSIALVLRACWTGRGAG